MTEVNANIAGPPPEAPPKPPQKQSDFPFAVTVAEVYDGPLDLLLDLIRKQDIDIYDIPIARITAQYLSYVERMRQLDVNVAADFIYMASVLIHIKSKMLLPRDPDAPADAQEDPRAELVNRLLEHEKFRTAAQMLLQKQQIEDAALTNPAIRDFIDAEGTEPELAADIIDLVKTFQQILQRAKTRQALVCMFLALLELVRLQAIQLRQEALFGEILVRKHSEFDNVLGEQSSVRDDWR